MYSPLAMQQVEVDNMWFHGFMLKNTVKTIILLPFKRKYFNMYVFNVLNEMYSCDSNAEYSVVITLVFSVTWSFRNHSNMLIWCKTFLKTSVLLNLKKKSLFEIEIFCNIINVFTLTFNQFSAFLLYKSINFFKKKKKKSLIGIVSRMPNQQQQRVKKHH